MEMRSYFTLPALGGWVATFVSPVLPFAAICSVLVVTDVLTSVTMQRRMVRRKLLPPETPLLVSGKLGHTAVTLAKTYAGLLIAYGVDVVFVTDGWCLKFVGGFVCFRQVLSILENESSATDSTWARHARRILMDKASRYKA